MEKPSITPPCRGWSALWSVRQKLGKNRRSCYIFPVGQIGWQELAAGRKRTAIWESATLDLVRARGPQTGGKPYLNRP
jgi:hypothetical protein